TAWSIPRLGRQAGPSPTTKLAIARANARTRAGRLWFGRRRSWNKGLARVYLQIDPSVVLSPGPRKIRLLERTRLCGSAALRREAIQRSVNLSKRVSA